MGPNGKPCHGGEETSKCTGLITIKELPMEESRIGAADDLNWKECAGSPECWHCRARDALSEAFWWLGWDWTGFLDPVF